MNRLIQHCLNSGAANGGGGRAPPEMSLKFDSKCYTTPYSYVCCSSQHIKQPKAGTQQLFSCLLLCYNLAQDQCIYFNTTARRGATVQVQFFYLKMHQKLFGSRRPGSARARWGNLQTYSALRFSCQDFMG